MDVFVKGRRLRVSRARSLGQGGEAEVFDVGGGVALKLFKGPDHPDFEGSPAAQEAARQRIAEHQEKLPRFPGCLPPRVVAPLELATGSDGRIVGYTMSLVAGAEPLHAYGDPLLHRSMGSPAEVVQALLDLRATLLGLHARGVVVGDLSDHNLLCRKGQAFVIDADSMQFGPFACRVFSERFVDPRICEFSSGRPLLAGAYGTQSDWYAFAALVLSSLVCVGPYGGVHRPAEAARRVAPGLRPLHRLTVLDPDVLYPRPALPLCRLPEPLLEHLTEVFVRDRREPLPEALLASLTWTKCATCGLVHARSRCPLCSKPIGLPAPTTVAGEMRARSLFRTAGRILASAVIDGRLGWLYHEDGAFRREDGRVVFAGQLDPSLRFVLQGSATLVCQGGRMLVFDGASAPPCVGIEPPSGGMAVASNGRRRFWIASGQLLRDGALGAERIGEVLGGQTRLWAGERFGLGFYRAGGLTVGLLFCADRAGLNDQLKLPPIAGRLVDARCHIDAGRAWLLLALEAGGRLRHRCVVVSAAGAIEAVEEIDPDADPTSWLARLDGKCAVSGSLLSTTAEGLVRIEVDGGHLRLARRFTRCPEALAGARELHPTHEGLAVVDDQEIRVLTL